MRHVKLKVGSTFTPKNMLLKKCLSLSLCLTAAFAQAPLARDPNGVVAVIDGKNITWGDIQQMMLVAPPEIVAGLQSNPQVALLNWALIEHLGKEGVERKLDQQSPSKEQIEAMKLRILSQARINQEMNGYQPSEQEIQKYYQGHLNQYQRATAKGVFVKFKVEAKVGATSTQDIAAMAQAILQSGSVQRSEAEALKIANDVAKQLREGGDFEAVSDKYSEDDASKFRGGDLGFVSYQSNHAEEVRKAAMSLGAKAVSEPIRAAAGFWVIRVEERSTAPLNDVILDINQAVRAEHMNAWMNGLRDRFQVEIKDPTIGLQTVKPGAQAAKPAAGTQK